VAIANFRRLKLRRQTRLQLGSKGANCNLGSSTVLLSAKNRGTRPFLETNPSYNRYTAFASFSKSIKQPREGSAAFFTSSSTS
jgi:hypothetical protein